MSLEMFYLLLLIYSSAVSTVHYATFNGEGGNVRRFEYLPYWANSWLLFNLVEWGGLICWVASVYLFVDTFTLFKGLLYWVIAEGIAMALVQRMLIIHSVSMLLSLASMVACLIIYSFYM